MKTIVIGLLCVFTYTQAFASYEYFESLEDLDTESEESFAEGIAGDGNADEDFDSLEYGFENDENVVFEESKEPEPIAIDKSDKEKRKSYHSYVLWRPSVLDDSGLMQTERNYYNLMVSISNFFNGDLQEEEEKEEETEKQGRNDDITQLDLPRISALTAKDEPTVYDNFVDTVNNMKVTVNDVVSRPEVKDNMFYIIMGLTAFLLLAFLNENLFKKTKPRTVQNHYLLPNTGAALKLPTYDECMKAEKNLLVNIEVFNDADLTLPVVAVLEDKVEEDGIQNN